MQWQARPAILGHGPRGAFGTTNDHAADSGVAYACILLSAALTVLSLAMLLRVPGSVTWLVVVLTLEGTPLMAAVPARNRRTPRWTR